MKFFIRHGTLVGLGLAELGVSVLAARTIDRHENYPVYLTLYLAMGICWLVASHYVLESGRSKSSPRLGIVLFFALAFRLVLLPTAPVLSDDIYRYVWDGRVAHAGFNPYRHPPDALELAPLRNEDYPGINNKDIPTIYPPVMQMAFFVVTSVSESLFTMKAFFVLTDVALCLVLIGLLRALKLDAARVLIYAWSPLPIVEIGASGHNDVLGALLLMAALLALARHEPLWAASWLTLSGLAKLVGFAAVPIFARHVRRSSLVIVPLLTVVLSLPYAGAGTLAFRGLREYGLRWRGNDGLFHVLYWLSGSLDAAKGVAAVVLAGLTIYLVVRRVPPARATYLTVGAILLLTATVHPWYLLWIAPFLCLYPSPAWMFLSLSVALSYHAAFLSTPGEPWQDVTWVKLVEYVPFFGLALLTRLRALKSGSGPE